MSRGPGPYGLLGGGCCSKTVVVLSPAKGKVWAVHIARILSTRRASVGEGRVGEALSTALLPLSLAVLRATHNQADIGPCAGG